jgi:hypothetical protein
MNAKEQAKRRCVNLIREITALEQSGKTGHKQWHQAKQALSRALRAYTKAGATHHELYRLANGECDG